MTTFASNPEPFVQGATTVAATVAEKTIEVIVPKVGETIAGATSIGFGPYAILGGLLLFIGLVVVCRKRLKLRRELIAPVVVFLFVFFVICCNGYLIR